MGAYKTSIEEKIANYKKNYGFRGKERSGVMKVGEKKIWYLCDGEKEDCKKKYCYKNTKENPCRHTKDISHAVNFRKEKHGSYEIYRETGCDDKEKFMMTHMHVKSKDGTMREEIEIVDVKNKRSLGVFKVINNSQHIITNPVDAPEIEAIYKERFDIAK